MSSVDEIGLKDSDGIFNVPPNPDVLGVSSKLIPTLQPLVYWPDARLSRTCKDVTSFDDELGQLILDLAFTMKKKDGIGIAAPQIGELLNVIIVEEQLDFSHPIPLVNPKIIQSNENSYTMTEGCLSVPGYYEERSRPQSVIVEYNSPSGEKRTKEFQGLGAFVVQHEIEHLKGKVFVDGLSRLKQGRILNKVKKTRRRGR